MYLLGIRKLAERQKLLCPYPEVGLIPVAEKVFPIACFPQPAEPILLVEIGDRELVSFLCLSPAG
jgi:hypothetical protein